MIKFSLFQWSDPNDGLTLRKTGYAAKPQTTRVSADNAAKPQTTREAQLRRQRAQRSHFPIIFLIFPNKSLPISDSAALSTRWMESSTSSLPLQCSRTMLASTLPRTLFRT